MSTAAGRDSRARLLDAARDVVATDGLEGLTLRAIARRAGVSHGAPLRHFPTLAALLSAVAADGFGRLIATVDDHLAAAERGAATRGTPLTAVERIGVAGQGYLDFARSDPGVFAVTFRRERVDVDDADYQAQGYRSFRQLVGLVEAAQAEGWHADRAADALACVLWAHVHGLAVLSLHGAFGGVAGDDTLGDLHQLSLELSVGPGAPASASSARTSDTSSSP
ncbi:MAG TPA: TetR/AcrR family transcriptional regulator [Acidimicrobiales bacterium]|nr:TetR/AcrR family transcriptional regulator [Acidimicrobiales bacterium]